MTHVAEFLAARPRMAMLSSLRSDGRPLTVPVWFDWDGSAVRMFAAADSPKVSRVQRDPRVSVVVANEHDEPEFWVAFDGDARIEAHGGLELAARLAARYWDLDQPAQAAALEAWQEAGEDAFRLIVLDDPRIRTYA